MLLNFTWIGNHNDAKASTTTTTKRVTRFRPRYDSLVALRPETTVRHKRIHIRKYKPVININGIKYELEKKMMWKAVYVMPLVLKRQDADRTPSFEYS